VPFRGELRCDACAAREVGDASENEELAEAGRPVLEMGRAAGAVFALGFLISLLPWDRVGTRTGFLSGWSPRPDPWPLLAALLLLAAAVAAVRSPPEGRFRGRHLAPVVLGALAVLAAALSVPAPDLTIRGPVPFLVLAAALAGTILAALALRVPAPARRP
jgi:hypothetical protein